MRRMWLGREMVVAGLPPLVEPMHYTYNNQGARNIPCSLIITNQLSMYKSSFCQE